MRSIRRGIKEMDLILSKFSDRQLHHLTGEELDVYEALLNENDQDLLGWVTGQFPPEEKYKQLILKIESTALQP
ncbi:MAG: succinate dehydrogenase assembly factor 2 [Pseudomonadota bacterium]